MSTIIVPAASIIVPSERQRSDYPKEHIRELADSITENGLIHAITATPALELITGFCRLNAVQVLTQPYLYGSTLVEPGYVPVLRLDPSDHAAQFRLELEENLRRRALSPVDESRAIAKLHRLLESQADKVWFNKDTARVVADLQGKDSAAVPSTHITDSLLVDKFSDDPDVQRAKSIKEAVKIARRKQDTNFRTAMASSLNNTSSFGILLEGDLLNTLPGFITSSVSCILTDPPYGMDADTFGDQSLLEGHKYKDDKESANKISDFILKEGFRIAKDDCHLYMFCDIRNWQTLHDLAKSHGWAPYPTPLIWDKVNIGHAPQPGLFLRRYEAILFARKGDRKLMQSRSDMFSFPAVKDKIHAAQKPVELYAELLKLSCYPGESILDPCAGSGTIFRAAKALKLTAFGCENEPNAIAMCKLALKGE